MDTCSYAFERTNNCQLFALIWWIVPVSNTNYVDVSSRRSRTPTTCWTRWLTSWKAMQKTLSLKTVSVKVPQEQDLSSIDFACPVTMSISTRFVWRPCIPFSLHRCIIKNRCLSWPFRWQGELACTSIYILLGLMLAFKMIDAHTSKSRCFKCFEQLVSCQVILGKWLDHLFP